MVEIDIASTTLVEGGQISRANARTPGEVRARAVVFRTLRLVPDELPVGRRGAQTARVLLHAFEHAWDRRVRDLEGTPWDIVERLLRSGDLSKLYSEQAFCEGFALLHEVCPLLFVRVNRSEYYVPFGELRDGARLDGLTEWCDAAVRRQREAELRLFCRDTRAPRLSRIRTSLHSRLSRYERAQEIPTVAPVHPDNAIAAAAAELERLGPAREGDGGDRHTFVCACVGEDFGLEPAEFQPLIEDWNSTCEPPWSPDELEKKLASARRNRKRPFGYRVATVGGREGQPSGEFEKTGSMRPVSKDRSHPSCFYRQPVTFADTWAAAERLTSIGRDSEVSEAAVWAARRGLDAKTLAERDIVRVLTSDTPAEPSCRFERRRWAQGGYQLVFATFDATGQLRGLRARHVEDGASCTGQKKPAVKELNPAGHSATGLVFANAAGVEVLRGASADLVWIGEGGPDFATLATLLPEHVAVIGIFSGSWTRELAAKIARCSRVVLATDADGPGRKYAREIAASVLEESWPFDPPDLAVLRLPDRSDVNRAHQRGELDLGRLERFTVVQRVKGPTVERGAPEGRPRVGWTERALAMLAARPWSFEGSSRELARALLVCEGARMTAAEVRGLERAIVRLRETGALPPSVKLTAAVPFDWRTTS